jgi:hypothetical protein
VSDGGTLDLDGGTTLNTTAAGTTSQRAAQADAGRQEPGRVPLPGPTRNNEPTPDTLFTEMLSMRRASRWSEAALTARKFLLRAPTDPRAGLVAFELGRIEMDRLGRFSEAAVRLRQATTLAPQAPFVEDALAREVRALESAGDLNECRTRRKAYLERFPAGLHRPTVEATCR